MKESSSVIWIITKKEFLSHLLTFRLWAAVVLSLLLIPLCVYVSGQRYEENLSTYNIQTQKYERELKDARVYSFVRPVVVRPPQVLSILCSGIESKVGSMVPIRFGTVPYLPTGQVHGRENPFLATFPSVDMVFILLIVISLFSILLTYDAICGEKEEGLLKQILTNSLLRNDILLGKYFGALLVMLPLLAIVYLVSLLIMLSSTHVQLTSDHLARIGTLFVLTLVYSSVFVLMGLLISVRTSRSSISLMLSLFIWVLIVLVVPNASFHIADQIYPVPSVKTIDDTIAELENERGQQFNELRSQLPPEKFAVNLFYRGHSDGGIIVAGNPKERYDHLLQQERIDTKLRLEYAEKKGDVRRTYIDALVNQRRLGSWMSAVSPAFLFREVCEGVMGVGAYGYHDFMRQVRMYRLAVIQYLQAKRETDPYRYITPDDPDQMMVLDDWVRHYTNGRYASFEALASGRTVVELVREFMKVFDRSKATHLSEELFSRVDLSDLPRFEFRSHSIESSMFLSLYPIAILFLMNVVLFYLSHRSLVRYDAR